MRTTYKTIQKQVLTTQSFWTSLEKALALS